MNLPHLLDQARLEHAQALAEVARLESVARRIGRRSPDRRSAVSLGLAAARDELRRTESRLAALLDAAAEQVSPALMSGSEVAA